VELTRSATHRALIEAHFGCRARFKAARNALIFRESDLERPFVTHNAELLAMLGAQLDAELNARRARQTLGDQVTSALKRLLAGQRPTIQAVARQLNLSSRTLQRRLGEGGATFQQLLDEGSPRIGAPLPWPEFHRTQRDRLSAWLRRSEFLLPRLPWVGRDIARSMAKQPPPPRCRLRQDRVHLGTV
jgi:hypothetical protein